MNFPILSQVWLSDQVKSIGNHAFSMQNENGAVLDIRIPKRIEFIGENVFTGRQNVNVLAYYDSIAEQID